mgnify:CR=1 FL=1
MSGFSVVEMWTSMGWLAKGTVLFMAVMSLWSIGVIVERMLTYSSGSKQSYQFVLGLREQMMQKKLEEAITAAKGHGKSPIAKVMHAGLAEYVAGMTALKAKGPDDVGEFDLVDAVNRALERVKEREIANLRRGLGGLATVASAAPFIGLFGTVVGIINAFGKLSGGGGLDVVGPGIAEALVSTAFGLLVAIPAAMMFNYFTGRVEFMVVDMNDVSSEFIDYVLKEGRAK